MISRREVSYSFKAVAEWLNFKLCQNYLSPGTPDAFADSLNQFRYHIRKYRILIGRDALAYDHWAWMSRQCVPSPLLLLMLLLLLLVRLRLLLSPRH
jgi:hypothetical protein